jgi:molybdate transport system substrate-binding protein
LEITVYAAASLKDALGALGTVCASQSGAAPVYNFGASNDLARQILAAGKADIFFSADTAWMDEVAKSNMVDTASRRSLLSNQLVVVVPDDSTLQISSAADLASEAIQRLSLANPAAVPAGKYARAWLEKAGVWDKVGDRVIPAPDVRAALAAVEEGAVQAGVVYRTDAAIARHARIAFTVPEADGPRITYPVAVLKDRPHMDAARRTVDCYAGPEGTAHFERFGFIVIEGSAAAAAAPTKPSN